MQPTQPPAGDYFPAPDFPGCYRHPDRPTGVRCVRCNRPICPECQYAASVGFQCPDDVRAGAATVRRARTVVGARVSNARPFVSYGLIALNVLAYIATALSPGGTLADNTGSKLYSDWLLTPYLVGHNHDYERLITAAFLHIGPFHLIVNMIALYMVGPALERILGWWRFAAVYLLAALGGSVGVLVFGGVLGSVAGASGAIYGMFACALVLSRIVGFDRRSLLITIGVNFLITFSVPGISKLGHIGGFVIGGLATLALLGWSMNAKPFTQRTTAIQVAGLGGLLVALLVIAGVRIGSLSNYEIPQPNGARAAPTAGAVPGVVAAAAPAAGNVLKVVHTVDEPGENYNRVITTVEEAVDNSAP
ncbi:MAG: rhomboid family intrarane serine protease [Frankiales bacterium]|nr:rhomboid family intrarane serine protease [Frankiales bacterium]